MSAGALPPLVRLPCHVHGDAAMSAVLRQALQCLPSLHSMDEAIPVLHPESPGPPPKLYVCLCGCGLCHSIHSAQTGCSSSQASSTHLTPLRLRPALPRHMLVVNCFVFGCLFYVLCQVLSAATSPMAGMADSPMMHHAGTPTQPAQRPFRPPVEVRHTHYCFRHRQKPVDIRRPHIQWHGACTGETTSLEWTVTSPTTKCSLTCQ